MDDAGLPPQTEDECVEVGGSTLAALLLEPLHQPQAHSGYLFGVVLVAVITAHTITARDRHRGAFHDAEEVA